jgi:hypothetical protein
MGSGWGIGIPMNRQEAVSILKEMIAICSSFRDAQAVAIAKNKANDNWELQVHCVPHPSEIACLEKIVAEHLLEMVTSNGKTVFRSRSKL